MDQRSDYAVRYVASMPSPQECSAVRPVHDGLHQSLAPYRPVRGCRAVPVRYLHLTILRGRLHGRHRAGPTGMLLPGQPSKGFQNCLMAPTDLFGRDITSLAIPTCRMTASRTSTASVSRSTPFQKGIMVSIDLFCMSFDVVRLNVVMNSDIRDDDHTFFHWADRQDCGTAPHWLSDFFERRSGRSLKENIDPWVSSSSGLSGVFPLLLLAHAFSLFGLS